MGEDVGLVEGLTVGVDEGTAVGEDVGTVDGVDVGADVGTYVGWGVGIVEGSEVGGMLGAQVGEGVGSTVGGVEDESASWEMTSEPTTVLARVVATFVTVTVAPGIPARCGS